MKLTLMREPSAALPVLMSLAALCIVVGHIAVYGFVHETDEGTAAHIFQLLMAGQVPVIAWFAMKWLSRDTAQALRVLVLQLLAAIPPFVALWILEHNSP